MTETTYFSEFIKQYRASLPSSNELMSHINLLKESADEVVSDYQHGNTQKWIDLMQGPNDLGIEVTRQDALDAISSIVTNTDRIIELTNLFIHEVERYDIAHGKSAVVPSSLPSHARINGHMLMGYAVGQALALHYAPEKSPIGKFFKNLLPRMTAENISLIIAVLSFILTLLPNAQLDKLIELQQEENLLIRKNNELVETQYEQMNEWLAHITETSEEEANATYEQFEMIKEMVKAIEQLTEKIDAIPCTSESEKVDGENLDACCDCACHSE